MPTMLLQRSAKGARPLKSVVPGGCAACNRGTRPDTVNRTIKLRLLARPPAQVSTAIRLKQQK